MRSIATLLVLFLAAFAAAEESVQVQIDEASKVGACDGAVTDRYMEIVQNLETQYTQQLEEAKASCESQSQLQLASAEESVQEYKELADQAQQEVEDLQAKYDQDLAAAKQDAEEQKKQVEEEMQLLSTKHSALEARHADQASELETALESLNVSREKIVALQAELEQIRKDLDEIQNMYINRHLIKRRYQEAKDAVEYFYSGKLLPFLAATKEAIVNVYTQAMTKYHELCVVLEPVWEALSKLTKQAIEQASVAWQHIVTFASPHVEKARTVFDEKAGPHVAIASEKLQTLKAESLQKIQGSPVYPHILKAMAALEQVQRHITGGLFQMSKQALVLLEKHEAPDRLVAAASYVKENARSVAIYLEASIATLLVILILNSVFGGGGRSRRQARVNGYAAKPKVKKA